MPELALRRWLFLALVAASTAAAVLELWSVLRIDGLSLPEFSFLALFAILFGWIAASFWLAGFGWAARAGRARLLPLSEAEGPSASRTAILMPVYNEDVARVFAGIRAMYESLGGDAGFDFYVLSDSTDPAHWIAEEAEWHRLIGALALPGKGRIFYRHRPHNKGRKSGNIQDFCEHWGALYDYMVVLDADSLMSGACLGRLVRLMDANPRAALIQAPAQLVGRSTLFARMQQFASSVYGPLFAAGLCWLQGPDGNYWGHNAIIRVRPFMAHCGLPALPGRPPFGGEIMSHDFVEAALLVRAGWQVWMDPDIGGSFEEPPPTIVDFLKRDRRWAQGNLQHLKVILAQGLKMPSRLHLAMGIMSYLASPLWLLLLIVSAVNLASTQPAAPLLYLGRLPQLALSVSHAGELLRLCGATLVLLYGPRLMALLSVLADAGRRRAHGGGRALILSALDENLFATLFAPVVMLAHCWFILSLVLGSATGWGTQCRDDRGLAFRATLKSFWPYMAAGLAAGLLLYRLAPEELAWFAPLLAGLVLAVPTVAITATVRLGRAAARRGLFLVPSETEALTVLNRTHALLDERRTQSFGPYPDAILTDRELRTLHLSLLAGRSPPSAPPAEGTDTETVSPRNREAWMALLHDPKSLLAASLQ